MRWSTGENVKTTKRGLPVAVEEPIDDIQTLNKATIFSINGYLFFNKIGNHSFSLSNNLINFLIVNT
jgi:hypothetical protein